MAEDFLDLRMSEDASFALATLGEDDRRTISAWLDHLRDWRNDPFLRSRAKRLKPDEELYVLHLGRDLVIAFQIAGNQATILSIFRGEALRRFGAAVTQIMG